MTRFLLTASLLVLAARPALAQMPATPAPALPAPVAAPQATPPGVVPTLPAPITLPTLSATQSAFLAQWLASSDEHGLGRTPARITLEGEALVRAALDRARALRVGRMERQDFLEIWAMRPAAYDPLPEFAAAVAADRLAQWANALTPPYSGYEGLRKGLAVYEAIRTAGGWPKLTATSTPAAIRARLAIEDKTVVANEPIAEAIQRAQGRYGLNPTGTLDARTLASLNVPVADRIAAIRANMERWRWLPRQLPVNRVQVNIAAAVLTVFEGDAPVKSMRAVTGRPGNETPMLTSSIHSIVLNPPWNVPMSIARKELFPQGKGTLKAKGYRIVPIEGGGERIVQPPGPNNALGQLKFDFDNPFAVYLHDTAARSGFNSFDRLASHGCIRLQKPVALAQRFLEADPKWTPEAVQAAIDSGKTQRVMLPERVQVYLLYWTAFASANGTMNFREDPYKWDALLASRIAAAEKRATAAPVQVAATKG